MRRRHWTFLASIIGLIGIWLVVTHALYVLRRPRPPEKVVICIDPGHPSEFSSGRAWQNGTTELDINWQVAQKLKSVLESDPRIRVVMTRDKRDELMRNYDRAEIANECGAVIAVHLHCDAGPSHGYTIYHPDKQVSVLGTLCPPETVITDSGKAADAIHTTMKEWLAGWLHDRGIKGDSKTKPGRSAGGLTTSVYSTVPTVTIEMVFLSNRHDAGFIKSDAGQHLMAGAIARGAKDFARPQLKTYAGLYRRYLNEISKY